MQRTGLSISQRVDTTLKVDPRLVLSAQMLELNQQELIQAIETELNENPALELLEDEGDPITDEDILRAIAPHELVPGSEDREFLRSLADGEDAPDWVELAAGITSLSEYLRVQLFPKVPKKLELVAEYIIDSLNDDGYLQESVEQLALTTESSLEDVELVIKKLKECEPAGVGAANLLECLVLQLRSPEKLEQTIARDMLLNYFEEFLQRKTMRLSRKFGVLPEVIEGSYAEVLKLTPFPTQSFTVSQNSQQSRSFGVLPDLLIFRDETGWSIEVNGPNSTSVRVDPSYQRRYDEIANCHKAAKDEKRHVSTYVHRAMDFIGSLEQRRRTMRLIGQHLISTQAGFAATGEYQFLQPLTRTSLAHAIGLHESTVSRATMGKFVQLANGEIVSFEVFFKPALRIQKLIEQILATENPDNPLSDGRISEILAGKGIQVARRTVNKYRDRTKLLSSRKRFSA